MLGSLRCSRSARVGEHSAAGGRTSRSARRGSCSAASGFPPSYARPEARPRSAGTEHRRGCAAAVVRAGFTHARAGRVSWRIVAWMTPPSVVGAWAATSGARCLRAPPAADRGRPRLERPRHPFRAPGGAHVPPASPGGLRLGRTHRPARRSGGPDPRNAPDAGAPAQRRAPGPRGRGDEPRRRILPRRRRLRGHLRRRLEVEWLVLAVSLAGALPGAWLGAR